ncbi:unnamed protein product [Symbiodinium necroappetens]|uniref:Uncharacterized protein n=1 Tax=Symbiodinium necroappetens TaxID=1628268 RepID=A0A812RE41_9DINO|nr:unnamed protein product [Symbiodinium necroappetens]
MAAGGTLPSDSEMEGEEELQSLQNSANIKQREKSCGWRWWGPLGVVLSVVLLVRGIGTNSAESSVAGPAQAAEAQEPMFLSDRLDRNDLEDDGDSESGPWFAEDLGGLLGMYEVPGPGCPVTCGTWTSCAGGVKTTTTTTCPHLIGLPPLPGGNLHGPPHCYSIPPLPGFYPGYGHWTGDHLEASNRLLEEDVPAAGPTPGAWGQGYGAYGKGAWGQGNGAYGKGAWGQGYGAYGKGAWGQGYPAAAAGYPAYGAGAWGRNGAYGQTPMGMGMASPAAMTNRTAYGKGAWGAGYGRKGAWYGQAYPAGAMGMASPAAANGTGIAPTLEGTGAWGAGYAAQGNPAWGAGYGAYGRGPWRQGYGAYGKGAWGQGYGGAYGKGAWGQRYGGAYGKGAWGQGYGAYGKGAWGQKYPAAATGYPAYGAGAWGKNAYGQGFPTAAMGKASPTVMTNGTSKAPAKGKGAWGSSYGAYGKAAWGHHKAAAGKTGTGNIATGAYGKGKGAWGRYGGKGYGAWGHSMSPGAAQQGLGAYGKGFAAYHAKKVKAASVPGQLPSSPAKTAAPGQTPAAPAALSAGQAPTPTAPAALKLGGAPVNPLYAKYWSKYYRNLYKGKWMKYYGGMKGGFNYYKPWSPHYRWLWGKLYGRFYGRKFICRRFGYRGHHLSGLAKWWWWNHPHPGPTTTTTTGTFTCLDGSGCEIPAIFQDDTFCDCPDCSDESQYTCATCPTTHTQTTSSTTSSVTSTVTVVTSTVTVVTSTVTAVTTTSTQVGPAPPPFIPPGGDAALGAALGSTLGAALAVTLGVGIGLSTGLGIFFAIGSFRLNVPNAGAFRKDADAIAALKKTVARIAGPNIDSSTIELTLPCENAKRRLDVRSALRRLDETVGVCFRIQIRGEEASTNVCERLSGFNSGSAQRILSEELSNLPGRSVQVVSWDAQPNPIAYNPNQNVGGDDSGFFDPSQAGISLG